MPVLFVLVFWIFNVFWLQPAQAEGLSYAFFQRKPLTLRVPQSAQEYERGLMFQTQLPPQEGMWFSFKKRQTVGFWMKHCLMPLDILFFVRTGPQSALYRLVGWQSAAPICRAEPCPIYQSPEAVDGVLELPANSQGLYQWHVGSVLFLNRV